jgi:hypothetical protein
VLKLFSNAIIGLGKQNANGLAGKSDILKSDKMTQIQDQRKDRFFTRIIFG